MSEKVLQQAFKSIAQEEVPEGTVDLWGRVAASLDERSVHRRSTRVAVRRVLQGALAAVVALLILFGLAQVPGVRAAAGEVIQRFGLVLVGEGEPRWGPSEDPRATPEVSAQRAEYMPLEEVQTQVPFVIPRPMWIPEFLKFRGAHVGRGPYTGNQNPPISVTLGYEPKKSFPELEEGGMFLQMFEGRISGGYAIPEQTAQEVKAGGISFTFARGAWHMGGGWNREADAGLLTWRDEQFTYVIGHSGLGLDQDELIRIALSVGIPEE